MIKTQPKILRRGLAMIIDYGLYVIFFAWFVMTFGKPNDDDGYTANGIETLIIPLVWLLYFPIVESINGQTLGKRIIGLKVVTKTGSEISLVESIKRRLLDVIDLFFYGIVAAIVVKNTPDHQRIGDLWAKTIVVGGEESNCQKCGEVLHLSAAEVIKGTFVCPNCTSTNTIS
jgi:uncharacterized RDD family membrane protein YckC